MKKVCSVEGCEVICHASGMCSKHYRRNLYTGTVDILWRRERGTGGLSADGRIRIKKNGRVALEHVLVAEKALGRRMPKGAVVHHVNQDPSDNRPENLVICPSIAYHLLIHKRERALDACGKPEYLKCIRCRRYDSPENLDFTKHKQYRHPSGVCRVIDRPA